MDWIKISDSLPPLGMVVECIGPKDWMYSKLGRDFFCLVRINGKNIWVTPSLTDFECEELEIKYWKSLHPDPNGKIPYLKIKKYNRTWEPVVVFKKKKIT